MKLKPFVKTSKKGKVAAGSLTFSYKKPKIGFWKDVSAAGTDPTAFGPWKIVTGGIAGDGVVLNDDGDIGEFTILGPGDDVNNGWVYVKQQFPVGAILNIQYNWTSFDPGPGGPPGVDRPVYWTQFAEPTGIPGDTDPRVEDTPASGTWDIMVAPGEWFAVGVYSTDSCCGRGFLEVSINVQTDVYIEYQIPDDPFSITNPYARLNCDDTQVAYQYVTGGGPYTTIQSLVDAFNASPGTSSYGTFLNAGSNSVGLRLPIATVIDVCGLGELALEVGED